MKIREVYGIFREHKNIPEALERFFRTSNIKYFEWLYYIWKVSWACIDRMEAVIP